MQLFFTNKSGSNVSLEEYLQDLEDTIVTLKKTVVHLEYQLSTQNQSKSEEAPKADCNYDKLKEEIIEEVNLIISDLL